MNNIKLTAPFESIINVGNVIKKNPNSLFLNLNKGIIINNNDNDGGTSSVFFIESGQLSVHRKYDEKLILNLQVPLVFGVIQSLTHSDNYYLKCNTNVDVFMLQNSFFNEEIDGRAMWKDVLKIVCYIVDEFELSQKTKNNSGNSYDIIKDCLYQIMSLSDEDRAKTSIFKYIISRHNISRSSVAKVLKALVDGQYIKVKRGVLLSIGKLPLKF